MLISIRGRVQGVGFRAWTRAEASALGLRGWVRNEPDGSVKALIAGPEEAVAAILEKLHEGPRGAKVVSITTEPADGAEVPSGFVVMG